jgi:hypothetical protein
MTSTMTYRQELMDPASWTVEIMRCGQLVPEPSEQAMRINNCEPTPAVDVECVLDPCAQV